MFTEYSPITDDEVAYIHKTLREMKDLDTDFRVSGAEWHNYLIGPPVSEADLLAYEEKCNIRLPIDYRSFLLRIGAGTGRAIVGRVNTGAGPGCGLDSRDADEDLASFDFQKPFPYTDTVYYEPHPNAHGVDENLPGLLCIGYYGGDWMPVLVVNGPAYGTVWTDRLQDYGCFPTGRTFGQWYAAWLGFLTEIAAPTIRADAVVKKIQPGMRRSEVIELCAPTGGDYREVIHFENRYNLAFDNLLSQVLMRPPKPYEINREDKVERVIAFSMNGSAWVFGSTPLSQKRLNTVTGF